MLRELGEVGRKTLASRLHRLADRIEREDPELIDFFLMVHEYVDLPMDQCGTDVLACFDEDRHLLAALVGWVEDNAEHVNDTLDAGGFVISYDTQEESVAAGLVTPEADA